jgi:hypothetical protein
MGIKKYVYKLLPKSIQQELDTKYLAKQQSTRLKEAYEKYKTSNITGASEYQNMVSAYCSSNGLLLDELQERVALEHPKKAFKVSDGVLGEISAIKSNTINKTLVQDGYLVFDNKLEDSKLLGLRQFAKERKAFIPPTYDTGVCFDEENPVSEIYRFKEDDLISNEIIQELIMDPTLISIAREYLGCEPIFDFPAMWWSTSFGNEPSSEAAQLYHFDLDRIKWLKIFIYINDVDEKNGPHCYVKSTHISGSKPQDLLNRGYQRVSDKDIFKYHSREQENKICGPAGSIFAGDTKCWHKGQQIQEGSRLVLELEYTSSCFGGEVREFKCSSPTKNFIAFCKANSFYSQRIKLHK